MSQNHFLKYLWNITRQCAGWVFAAVAVLVCFVTPDELLQPFGLNTVRVKLTCLAVLCLLSAAAAFCIARWKKNRPVTLYDREHSGIQIAFGNITDCMKDNTGGKHYTVVLSVNKDMDRMLDPDKIKPGSVHGQWLRYLSTLPPDEYEHAAAQIRDKKPRVGNCLIIRNVRNVDYVLAVSCTVQDDKSLCSETDYYKTVQSMITTLNKYCQLGETAYLPVIGAGNASLSRKTGQKLLRMLTEMLGFNTDLLTFRAKILVYDDPDGRMRRDIRLYALRPHD